MIGIERTAGSFRDPAGFVYQSGETLFRQVNHSGREEFERLISSGLYRALVDEGRLIPHTDADEDAEPFDARSAYKIIRPERIPFISYPYEWCFGQLKDAALLTLAIQRRAVEHGMSLKDASAYNVQFKDGRPVFIDTLSFESYRTGEPWRAYQQFCQHFLAPLSLMSLTDIRLNQLCRSNIDGIPLDLASRLLPRRSLLNLGLGIHLHLHARVQSAYSDTGTPTAPPRRSFNRGAMLGLLSSLETAIGKRRWEPSGTEWVDYPRDHGYSETALADKERIVAAFLARAEPATVWDLGANTGRFSRLAASRGITTVSFDLDPACVERNYREMRAQGETRILPLLLDLRNPSPASGWRNVERVSLVERGPADLVLALALIHHLAIVGNLPLEEISALLRELGHWLLIEFVPPDDPQVRRLMSRRGYVHHSYDRDAFERGFKANFDFECSEELAESGRVLYLMRRREQR